MYKIYLIAVFVLSSGTVLGQSADSVSKQKQVQYYKSKLSLNETKASQVNVIHDQYKASLKEITNNPNLPEEEKRKAAEKIIAEKNKKLEGLLTAEQLDVVVSTTERKRSTKEKKHDLIVTRKDTANLREQMGKALIIPKDKAQQVTLVQLTYKEKLRHLLSDTTLGYPDKKSQITQLGRERNRKLKSLLSPEQMNKIIPPAEQKL
jgi:hypothetical protein